MVEIMAIVLTNGQFYIATNKSGRIIKTPIVEDAQMFYSVNAAMQKMQKTPGKCKGYYLYDTESDTRISGAKKKKNRKKYSKEERKIIYNKTNGRCALCGQRLLLENMTLDHIVPLSVGGKDNMENLQAACFACNQFKRNILPEDFVDRITKIFLYQTEKQVGNGIKWKIIKMLIEERKS